MTVLRQLLLSVTVVVALILVGTLVFSVNASRNYLSMQVQSESDNAATSLALLLSQPANQDQASRELLITALFDSGHFEVIELHDSDGNELVARRVQGAAGSPAPAWFSRWLPLRIPSAQREIMDGWTQAGVLTVVADATDARKALWEGAVRVLLWVLFAGVLWVVFVTALMRWMRRALQGEVTRQIQRVAEGSDVGPARGHKRVADLLPSTQVIEQARERVQASKQEAERQIESLTLELNHDAVTGLPNRRYFMNEMRRALHASDAGQGGFVLLCRQRDLGAMAAELTRDQLDAWLRRTGERLQQVLRDYGDATLHLGRLNGSDFAVLIQGADGPEAMRIAQAVHHSLQESRLALAGGRYCRWAFAMTDYVQNDDLGVVFARLDTGLMAAESAGHNEIELLSSSGGAQPAAAPTAGEAAWHELLTQALNEDTVGLATARVIYGRQGYHQPRYESTLTITDPSQRDGEPLTGFAFMPAAVRLGLSAEFDLRAVRLALAWLAENSAELVVRVSVSSLLKEGFIQTVCHSLTAGQAPDGKSMLSRLIIELDAYGVSTYPAEVREFCEMVHDAGVRVGVRGVAQHLDVVARLEVLPVVYIKLAGGFIEDLGTSQGAVSLLNAVAHTATAARIHILVDDMPSEAAAMLLRDHGAQFRITKDD